MKRVLVVGWCVPNKVIDGASLFIRDLAKYYQQQGHYVEIFTIARPEKITFRKQVIPWKIYARNSAGLRFNVLARPWGLLYTNPSDPLSSVHEPRTNKIWADFLDGTGPWDVVHFNDVNPFEMIETAKKKGSGIRYSFHNFYMLFPIEQLFSARKFRQNPYQDLTIYDYSGRSAVSEYEALGVLPPMPEARKAELARQFDERNQYGRYLLSEVIDEVLGASAPHIIYAREAFNAAYPNLIQTDFALSRNGASVRQGGFIKGLIQKSRKLEKALAKFERKFRNHTKKIFGVYANVSRYKGHHIITKAVEELEDCTGEFEVRFYGHTDFDPDYMKFLSSKIDGSDFLKHHVKVMGGYNRDEMPLITEETLISIGCSATVLGAGGGVYEALQEGNLPLFVKDYTLVRELRLVEEVNGRSDLEPSRLFYPCGDASALAELMRKIIRQEIDLRLWYDRALSIPLTGGTIFSNFDKVWSLQQ